MKENCAECKNHDVFWKGAGCNLLNNGEKCKFAPREKRNPVPQPRKAQNMQNKDYR